MSAGRFVPPRTFVLLGSAVVLLLNHVLPAASLDCGTNSANVENRLKKSLLCNGYRTDARPRKDQSDTVNVTVAYLVLSYEFDEPDDLLEMNVMLNMHWYDDYIRWNSSAWGNIDRMAINADELWLPDFRHFSSFQNPVSLPECTNPQCLVRSDGLVTCGPVCSLNTKCDADYFRWPFDVHHCGMWYGMWAHSMDEVDVHGRNICLAHGDTIVSPKWEVVSLEKDRETLKSAHNFEYSVLYFRLTVQRRSSFETVAVLSPILVLALLNLYTVWLRSDCLERKTLLVVSIYCHFSFLQLMEWALPANRDSLPGCMIFFTNSLVMTGLIALLTLFNCWIRSGLNGNAMLNRLTGSLSDNRVAELILAADYLGLNYKVTKNESENSWEKRATLFDRVLAVVSLLFYLALFFLYLTFNHWPVVDDGMCILQGTN
ncbi:AGAP010057-PA-like protein [Anopheles sinensis]|uniref:AGAP010057-PA-like protein n=1 Tax=Anopheles sinensis TaxID=74873 RepID=A0A084W3Y7_ANOSI|nr:AGAP010057-PA-like protein [Anopheles sinensis]